MKEFAAFFSLLEKEGKGDCIVMFDTLAQTFHYHMARIGRAYYQDEEALGYEFVSLHEYEQRYEDKPLEKK